MNIVATGAICFGIVIGWITHRTIRRSAQGVGLSDIATIIGAVGGGALTGLFGPGDGTFFAAYAIGLFIGFFMYLILASTVLKNNDWLSE